MPRTQRDPERERLWRNRLAEHQRSQLTVREFCRTRGIAESRFHFWRQEIARRDRQSPAFLPVAVVPTPAPVSPANEPIELRLAGGHELRLRAGCDRRLLADLIGLLARREEHPC